MRTASFAILMSLVLAASTSGAPPKKLGRAVVTYYWLIDESSSRYRGKDTTTLEDARGRVIARTTARFRRDLIMEGSGLLRDGRTIEYDRKSHGKNRFRLARSKYGGGRLGCACASPPSSFESAATCAFCSGGAATGVILRICRSVENMALTPSGKVAVFDANATCERPKRNHNQRLRSRTEAGTANRYKPASNILTTSENPFSRA